jgi:general stress protein 26
MTQKTSSFANQNGQLSGLGDSEDFDQYWKKNSKGTWYEGLSAPAAIVIGVGGFLASSVIQTWIGAHVLGYDD